MSEDLNLQCTSYAALTLHMDILIALGLLHLKHIEGGTAQAPYQEGGEDEGLLLCQAIGCCWGMPWALCSCRDVQGPWAAHCRDVRSSCRDVQGPLAAHCRLAEGHKSTSTCSSGLCTPVLLCAPHSFLALCTWNSQMHAAHGRQISTHPAPVSMECWICILSTGTTPGRAHHWPTLPSGTWSWAEQGCQSCPEQSSAESWLGSPAQPSGVPHSNWGCSRLPGCLCVQLGRWQLPAGFVGDMSPLKAGLSLCKHSCRSSDSQGQVIKGSPPPLTTAFIGLHCWNHLTLRRGCKIIPRMNPAHLDRSDHFHCWIGLGFSHLLHELEGFLVRLPQVLVSSQY